MIFRSPHVVHFLHEALLAAFTNQLKVWPCCILPQKRQQRLCHALSTRWRSASVVLSQEGIHWFFAEFWAATCGPGYQARVDAGRLSSIAAVYSLLVWKEPGYSLHFFRVIRSKKQMLRSFLPTLHPMSCFELPFDHLTRLEPYARWFFFFF